MFIIMVGCNSSFEDIPSEYVGVANLLGHGDCGLGGITFVQNENRVVDLARDIQSFAIDFDNSHFDNAHNKPEMFDLWCEYLKEALLGKTVKGSNTFKYIVNDPQFTINLARIYNPITE